MFFASLKRNNICYKYLLFVFTTILLIILIDRNLKKSKFSNSFIESLKGPISYDDPKLIQYIREEVLVPPSKLSYPKKTLKELNIAKNVVNHSVHFYKKFIEVIFNNTGPGVFIEAGALDGEAMSNTIWLEKTKNWTGLLVEPNPIQFKRLLSKNRHSWSANACLSIDNYPKMEKLSIRDNVDKANTDARLASMSLIVRDKDDENQYDHPVKHFNTFFSSYFNCQCYPLNSLLLALNYTTIDLFSLDVELVEEGILRSFNFEMFDVQILFIEYFYFDKTIVIKDFLESKGFIFVANQGPDMIFVKKGSKYQSMVDQKYPNREVFLYNIDKIIV